VPGRRSTRAQYELTVPGLALVPAAGVTAVGVLPTHRRRGLLSRMMRRQLDDVAELAIAEPKRLRTRLLHTAGRLLVDALQEAFVGRFGDHHAFLPARMLGRIDQASADIADLDRRIEALGYTVTLQPAA
jgi:GNAT superfamily N-acetyltransferase